jgi:hypothetical protein
VTEL